MAWTKTLLRQKFRALSIHLGIGLLIFIPLLYLLWFRWFPEPLFYTDGGWQGLRIMLFVDLTIGPLLTFMVFNPAKSRREFIFDFSCIALVQLAALGYGVHTIEKERMWVVALEDGAFHAVNYDSYKNQKIAANGWARYGAAPLYWVNVREPKTPDEKAGVGAYMFMEGLMPYQIEYLYDPITASGDALKKADLGTSKSTGDAALDKHLKDYQAQHKGSFTYVKLEGFFKTAVLVFDASNHYVDAIY